MSDQLTTNANQSAKESLRRAEAPLDSELAQQTELPVAPYKPFAKEPAAAEPYRPYREKPAPSEPPYEPYKGI